jgi:hypothetical protein
MRRTRQHLSAAATVVFLSTAGASLLGLLSTPLYLTHEFLRVGGDSLGALVGLGAGILWCTALLRRSDAAGRRGTSGKLVVAPVLGGAVAGSVAALLVQLPIELSVRLRSGWSPTLLEDMVRWDFRNHVLGQIFGIAYGLLLGAIGAALWPPVPRRAPDTAPSP